MPPHSFASIAFDVGVIDSPPSAVHRSSRAMRSLISRCASSTSSSGGTRSAGSHLDSASPRYGVGDYYFAMRQGAGWDCFSYCVRRFFREVRTRFHLRHPWYIPVKLLGELRAVRLAAQLYRREPKLLSMRNAETAAGHPLASRPLN